ncbi:hypothetical protein VI817_000551 [Penicillium citrinum]|nr:hypothetical protein VI817_000551 [Penicillium citrinum]
MTSNEQDAKTILPAIYPVLIPRTDTYISGSAPPLSAARRSEKLKRPGVAQLQKAVREYPESYAGHDERGN